VTVELGAFVVPDASDVDGLLAQVRAVEDGGLDLVGIQDHPYQRRFLDTFSLLAFLAARTSRVRCGARATCASRSGGLLARWRRGCGRFDRVWRGPANVNCAG
jgi:alkanesulfonate monooxygenase SsuD/methylene tetrahydromethanopterin reductase-like flavin-dependent oxidoreductase (luciferase family)